MSDEDNQNDEKKLPESGKVAKISRGALQAVGGAVPFAGGVFSAIAVHGQRGSKKKLIASSKIGFGCYKMSLKKKKTL